MGGQMHGGIFGGSFRSESALDLFLLHLRVPFSFKCLLLSDFHHFLPWRIFGETEK